MENSNKEQTNKEQTNKEQTNEEQNNEEQINEEQINEEQINEEQINEEQTNGEQTNKEQTIFLKTWALYLCYFLASTAVWIVVNAFRTYGWGGYYWLYGVGQIAFLILAQRQFHLKAQLDRIERLLTEKTPN